MSIALVRRLGHPRRHFTTSVTEPGVRLFGRSSISSATRLVPPSRTTWSPTSTSVDGDVRHRHVSRSALAWHAPLQSADGRVLGTGRSLVEYALELLS